jgi:hypothetical protein
MSEKELVDREKIENENYNLDIQQLDEQGQLSYKKENEIEAIREKKKNLTQIKVSC